MNKELQDNLLEIRIDILKDLGIKINNINLFKEKTRYYGYHEIFLQYGELFEKDETNGQITWIHEKLSFEEIWAAYELDQKLKNSFMIALAQFEQTFKTAMLEPVILAYSKWKTAQLLHKSKPDFLQSSYTFQSGRKINRGDLKARIRHIKQNYDEPYSDYNHVHNNKADPELIIKEMSFGVALNFFFLLPTQFQKEVLSSFFQTQPSLLEFEKITETLRLFNRRAAHNFRLLGFKTNNEYIYTKIYTIFTKIYNSDPVNQVKSNLTQNIDQFLANYPSDKTIVKEFNEIEKKQA